MPQNNDINAVGTVLADRPGYIWHQDIHRKLASERLHFFRIAFKPTYDRSLALSQIKAALKTHGIRSYVVWELFGDTDILLRAWVPPDTETKELRKEFDRCITGPHRAFIDPFSVDSIIDHWMWNSPVHTPSVRSIVDSSHLLGLNGRGIPKSSRDRYLAHNFIAPVRVTRTMKFFVIITRNESSGTAYYQEQDLEESLLSILRRDEKTVSHTALYQGSGFGRYLITGRVAPASWEALNLDLTERINELGMNRFSGTRTVTLVSAFRDAVDRREQLLPLDLRPLSADGTQEPPLSGLLDQEESRILEFKATAFCSLDAVTRGGLEPGKTPRMNHVIAKSIVGLLNAVGGRLAIGVAESKDYSLEDLSAWNPIAHGKYLVIGVDIDYRERKGWDGYLNKLRQYLSDAVVPGVDGWIDFFPSTYEGRTCCLIVVRRPDEWFYTKEADRFYVRIANSTVELRGPAADAYRRANPRTSQA